MPRDAAQQFLEQAETSQEELQVLNDELVTVNRQLREKVTQLEATTNDLVNLLASSRQKELTEAIWSEQRRLGQELHDTVGQELSGLGMMAKALQCRLRVRKCLRPARPGRSPRDCNWPREGSVTLPGACFRWRSTSRG